MLEDPIGSIFEDIKNTNDNSLELFAQGDVTLRTDLLNKEVVLVNCIHTDNELMKKSFKRFKIEFDLFDEFLTSFKRHKVSLDRKSRGEFVNVNMKNTLDRDLTRVSNLKNLTESRT